MDTSIEQAISLIQKFEGWRSKAYKCTAGVWTVGWGRTGKDVKEGTVSTPCQELPWLQKKVEDLSSLIRTVSLPSILLSDSQVATLISLIYNIGEGAFSSSGVRRFLLLGDVGKALAVWERWNKVGGKIDKGLVNRRAEEIRVFTSGMNRGG